MSCSMQPARARSAQTPAQSSISKATPAVARDPALDDRRPERERELRHVRTPVDATEAGLDLAVVAARHRQPHHLLERPGDPGALGVRVSGHRRADLGDHHVVVDAQGQGHVVQGGVRQALGPRADVPDTAHHLEILTVLVGLDLDGAAMDGTAGGGRL